MSGPDYYQRNDPRELSADDWRRVCAEAARLLRDPTTPTVVRVPVLGPLGTLIAGDWLAPNTAIAARTVVLTRRPWFAGPDRIVAEAVIMSGVGPDRIVDWTPGYGPPPALGPLDPA